MLIYLFFLGLCIGSFLNVLIDRLPKEQGIGGRSHCDYCKKTLQVRDLVPVFSFIFLGGKCRYCHKKLSIQYPFIELVTGITFASIWYMAQGSSPIIVMLSIALASSFIVIIMSDFKYHIIPDEMQITFLISAIVLLWFSGQSPVGIVRRLLEGLIVMLPILFLYVVTKQRGMGFGDVKLAYVIGVFQGIVFGLYSLYVAFVVGGVVSLFLIVLNKKKIKSHIAFGPFLILGTIIVVLWGKHIDSLFGR